MAEEITNDDNDGDVFPGTTPETDYEPPGPPEFPYVDPGNFVVDDVRYSVDAETMYVTVTWATTGEQYTATVNDMLRKSEEDGIKEGIQQAVDYFKGKYSQGVPTVVGD